MSGSGPTNVLPIFYRQIRMLDQVEDHDLGLLPAGDYHFAAETNAIPLVAEEICAAEGYYPIVFAGADQPRPVAVVGLRAGENLFVGSDGAWRAGCYVPMFASRYPFILIDGNDDRLHLGVDTTSARLATGSGRPLFEAGEPTKLTKDMLDFCVRFRRQHEFTAAFGAALHQHAVLVEYRFDVTAGGQAHSITSCHVVSEEKFNALPDDVFLNWRRAGWLPLITAHLLSLRHWQALGQLASERPASSLAA
jgi:SapC